MLKGFLDLVVSRHNEPTLQVKDFNEIIYSNIWCDFIPGFVNFGKYPLNSP